MTEDETLSIGAVARQTGLSERALRLYEAHGLLNPARAANGRRFYVRADIEALTRIQLLKKAGFTLSQIKLVMQASSPFADLIGDLISSRLENLQVELEALQQAIKLLSSVKIRLAQGEDVDLHTLCALIKTGERAMNEEQWQKVYDRYYTAEEQAEWKNAKEEAFKNIDIEAYEEKWNDLAKRIAASLPLDPASDKAQRFLTEWNNLLDPFLKNATPTMIEGADRLWNNHGDWQHDVHSPITPEVWAFIKEAQKNRVV